MSIKVMTRVWEFAPVRGGALLVLLALADYANDNGLCWPSVESIAEKARLRERQTRQILKDLHDGGLITREKGTGPYGANMYKVLMGAEIAPLQKPAQGVRPTAKRGAAHRPLTVIRTVIKEPSSGTASFLEERYRRLKEEAAH